MRNIYKYLKLFILNIVCYLSQVIKESKYKKIYIHILSSHEKLKKV